MALSDQPLVIQQFRTDREDNNLNVNGLIKEHVHSSFKTEILWNITAVCFVCWPHLFLWPVTALSYQLICIHLPATFPACSEPWVTEHISLALSCTVRAEWQAGFLKKKKKDRLVSKHVISTNRAALVLWQAKSTHYPLRLDGLFNTKIFT